MKTIVINTQAEMDALPRSFDEHTELQIRGKITEVRLAYTNAVISVCGSATIQYVYGSATIQRVCGSATIQYVCGNATIQRVYGSATIQHVYDSATIQYVCGNATIQRVYGSATIQHVYASATIQYVYGSATIQHVCGNATIRIESGTIDIMLGAAVAFVLGKCTIKSKSKTNTIIQRPESGTVDLWMMSEGVVAELGYVVLFKRVSSQYQTQENSLRETTWTPGTTLEHSSWDPHKEECGAGKYHACSLPVFCDEFRSTYGDKYVAIRVKTSDMHAWKDPAYPHKIAFRKGTVMYECDLSGKEIKP